MVKKKDRKGNGYNTELKDIVEKYPVGKRKPFLNRRGELAEPRKLHLRPEEFEAYRSRWEKSVAHISADIRSRVGPVFFNPYRQAGPYYGGVQTLFFLGAGEWHSDRDVRQEIEKVMMGIMDSKKNPVWFKFAHRVARSESLMAKDLRGRIHQNFRVLQRLGGMTPYGYKLKQVLACIDIRPGLDGGWEYRLRADFGDESEVIPIYDPGEGSKRGRRRRVEGVARDVVIKDVSQVGENVV